MRQIIKRCLFIILFAGIVISAFSSDIDTEAIYAIQKNYYFNPETESAEGDGTINNPFKDLSKTINLKLNPGDSILLASGTQFQGTIELTNATGTEEQPIVISSYSSGVKFEDNRPTIDASGFPNGILLENCSHIQVINLIVTANAGGMKVSGKSTPEMRCGILVQTDKPGKYGQICFSNIVVKDIFYEEPGFSRGKDEVNSANGTQKYGWGIRFINNTDGAILRNLKIENCEIQNVAHTGLKFTAKNKGIENISVVNNRVIQTGGPGIQMSGVKDGMVNGNYVDSSGSNNDTRKWGRGSGLWTWSTSNVIIQNNYFFNANGPGDSAGCHIDFNCSDVIVQYNFSANNAGGFCEILGNNFNCAYRYNISVNDGYRVKGKNGAFQEGKIFWLSGYVGNKQKPKGPFNSYVYNNTIYTKKDIVANFAVANTSEGILIANNIFCIEGESKLVAGDQYVPDKISSAPITNYFFENNLYLASSNWPKEVLVQDQSPLIGDPRFQNKGGLKMEDYIPTNIQLIKDKGIKIKKLKDDLVGLKIGLNVDHDILGNKIPGKPDIGAIELP